jgi:hypothetical protein
VIKSLSTKLEIYETDGRDMHKRNQTFSEIVIVRDR